NSEEYRELTGSNPPPTPIGARHYAEHGLPWFDLYDEEAADLPTDERLASVKSLAQLDEGATEEAPVEIDESLVRKLRPQTTRSTTDNDREKSTRDRKGVHMAKTTGIRGCVDRGIPTEQQAMARVKAVQD